MKALEYFSDEVKMANAIENPDEGIDWIMKMEKSDWQALLAMWDQRNAAWREAIMYFSGLVNLEDSLALLTKGLQESDPNIHVEAALSIADAILEGDDCPLPDDVKARLRDIAKSDIGKDFEELEELMKVI